PDGYACLRIDSRGAGRSPGYLDPRSAREIEDIYQSIEWAAMQPWCNGKVGMCGISYYATNQWQVAAKQPPHLAACCIWEGSSDVYREQARHGGILCTFRQHWYDMQVKSVQHGRGERGPRNPLTGDLVCGPETLTDEELAKNRIDVGQAHYEHVLRDEFYVARQADFAKITVPLLSAGNWGGAGLHLRGNVEGFLQIASEHKWLEMHGLEHWTEFYTDYGLAIQKRFFTRFLKDDASQWPDAPRVRLQVRGVDKFVLREENEWPLARTQWTPFYLDLRTRALRRQPQGDDTLTYDALGDGVTFVSDPLTEETEITGPSALKLSLSSSTKDADVFAVLRAFAPSGEEVVFQGAIDPHTPLAQGWLRVSHRKRDPGRTTPYRPWHPHDALRPLRQGEIADLDIEIWPTCIVLPPGYCIALTLRGRDYEYTGASGGRLSNFKNEMRGCGPFLHDDPRDRPPEIFGGKITLHTSTSNPAYVLLPIVPPKE
ncbi:MAG: CocE/NonD family hydrolase, partial [Candidatus Eremiobacteraeota bacterium]|nr:CocE/NonD family hydrolase [Candidatus Eremiobacteraeota bacterium]